MFLTTHKSLQKGYTLVELIVVFSLVVIISGAGFASFSTYTQHQSVDQAAADVKLAFNKARFDALSQVKPASVCTDPDTLLGYKVIFPDDHTYSIVADCQASSPPPSPEDVKQLSSGLKFSDTYTNCSGVEFYTLNNTVSIPSGCDSFDIRLNDSVKKTLTVGSNGIVTISR